MATKIVNAQNVRFVDNSAHLPLPFARVMGGVMILGNPGRDFSAKPNEVFPLDLF